VIKTINGKWPDPKELFEKMKIICPAFKSPSFRKEGDLLHTCYKTLHKEGYFVYEFF